MGSCRPVAEGAPLGRRQLPAVENHSNTGPTDILRTGFEVVCLATSSVFGFLRASLKPISVIFTCAACKQDGGSEGSPCLGLWSTIGLNN